MLEFMREHASSWIVKALFGIIVLVFVFWGVGGMQNDEQPVLATVNDKNILNKDFFQTYEREADYLRRNNPDLSSSDLEQMDLKKQVLERMINNYLLRQKAQEWGLFVTSQEVRQTISSMEVFQGQGKKFDPQRYKQVLQSSRLSPGQFESELSGDILGEKLQDLLLSPLQASDSLARDFFRYLSAEARVEYLHLSWEDFLSRVSLSQEEVQEYYEQNQEEFEQPAQMRMRYLVLTPESLARYQEVSAEEIRDYYQQNEDLFARQERAKARHILLRLDSEASEEEVDQARQKLQEIKQELQQGAEFSELAKAHSEGPSAIQGGDLGWFSRGSMQEDFEEAAFALQPDEISEPVRTEFGLHLIQLVDREEAGTADLDEVREEIRERLAQDKAAQALEDLLDEVLLLVLDTGSLQEAAQQLDLEAQKSDWFSKEQGPKELELDKEQMDKLFALQEGEPVQAPLRVQGGYLLAQKIEEKQAQVAPLQEVRPRIEERLRQDKAQALARKEAEDILQELEQGGKDEYQDQLQLSPAFTRQGRIPGLGQNQDLVREAFSSQPGQWLSRPFEFSSGYVLAKVEDIQDPSEEDWESSQDYLLSSLNRSKRQLFMQALLDDLRSRADIKIESPEVLEY
ncbi:MAG: SurA N-terminal domain-containing protein [Thermodesulfobacteriota bacterium]